MKFVIIGAGIAGLSIARDFLLRGFEVTVIDDQKVGFGTTNRCAGMLHSGARYVTKDREMALLCYKENRINKRILPHAVGKKPAFFVCLKNDAPDYERKFIEGCKTLNIPIQRISETAARDKEPHLGANLAHVFQTPDVVIDTFKLVFSYRDEVISRGGTILEETIVEKASYQKSKWVLETSKSKLSADYVINCTGDYLADTAIMFGARISLSYIYGTMAILQKRFSSRIITRCAPNTIGDVVVPLRGFSLAGSTWHERKDRDKVELTKEDEKGIREVASAMLPEALKAKLVSSLTSVRTHLRDSTYSRSFGLGRDYLILDHEIKDYIPQFVSVLPGKMTIARYVAEKTVDTILNKHDLTIKCKTAEIPISEPYGVIDYPYQFVID